MKEEIYFASLDKILTRYMEEYETRGLPFAMEPRPQKP